MRKRISNSNLVYKGGSIEDTRDSIDFDDFKEYNQYREEEEKKKEEENEKHDLITLYLLTFSKADFENYMSWSLDDLKNHIYSKRQENSIDDADDRACSRGYFLDGER